MKKLLLTLTLFGMFFSLTGCESSKIEKAKDSIDHIYEYTMDIAEMEYELTYCTDSTKKLLLERDIKINELHIENNTDILERIYNEVSEKGKIEIQTYAKDALYNSFYNIWN